MTSKLSGDHATIIEKVNLFGLWYSASKDEPPASNPKIRLQPYRLRGFLRYYEFGNEPVEHDPSIGNREASRGTVTQEIVPVSFEKILSVVLGSVNHEARPSREPQSKSLNFTWQQPPLPMMNNDD